MRFKKNIPAQLRLLILLPLVSLMAACNLIYEDCGKCDLTDEVEIGFTISTGVFSDPETKVEFGSEPGSSYENYIGIASGDFMFLLFDINGKYLRTFQPEPEDITPLGVPGIVPNPDTLGDPMPVNRAYYVRTKMNRPPANFYVVALLNYGGVNGRYPIGEDVASGSETPDLHIGLSTINDVVSNSASGGWGKFNYNIATPYVPTPTAPMPMYGVRRFDNFVARDHMLTDLGDVNVLRAYAKIRVRLVGDLAAGFDIDSVTLNNYSTVAYKAPNITENTPRGVTIDTEQYCTQAEVSTGSLPFRKITADIYEIYVPPYDNINAPLNRKATISVKLSNGMIFQDAIHFAYYDDNGRLPANPTYFNILRNQIIDYKITGISGAALTLELEANPWDVKQSTFHYTQLVTFAEGGFPAFVESTISSIDYSDQANGNVYVIMKQDNTIAEVNFTIMTPAGSTWQAILVREKGASDAFSFVDSGGNVIIEPTGDVGTPATLRIKKNLPQPAAGVDHNEYILRIMIHFPPPANVSFKVNYLELAGFYGTAKEYTVVQQASI